MSRQSLSRLVRQHGASSRVELPPPFLAPALHFPLISSSLQQTSRFSTSPAVAAREKSKQRGVSAIHRTGPRRPLLVSKHPLPKPVERPTARESTPDHGLWGFFGEDRAALIPPDVEYSHGMLDTSDLSDASGQWANLNAIQAAHGRSKSYGRSPGMTCTAFGGSASRNVTG